MAIEVAPVLRAMGLRRISGRLFLPKRSVCVFYLKQIEMCAPAAMLTVLKRDGARAARPNHAEILPLSNKNTTVEYRIHYSRIRPYREEKSS